MAAESIKSHLDCFGPFEIAFCNSFLKPEDALAKKMCYCYLARAHKCGHLFVSLSGDLNPTLDDLFEPEDRPKAEIETLIERGRATSFNAPYFTILDDKVLFTKNFSHLQTITDALSKKIANVPLDKICPDPYLEALSLNSDQKEAVRNAFQQSIFLLTGGPGCGKTHTAAAICDLFVQCTKTSPPSILLTAPTGKAAATLFAKFSALGSQASIKTGTLHAMMNDRNNKILTDDLIVVDECSMIDVRMMAELLQRTSSKSRLLLLGDPNQLPPIGLGCTLFDLVKALPKECKAILKSCMRTDVREIYALSQAVLARDAKAALSIADSMMSGPIDEANLAHFVREQAAIFAPFCRLSWQEALVAYQSYRILSPLRRGALGVDKLNGALFDALISSGMRIAVPIVVTKNAPWMDLYNGDCGILLADADLLGTAYFPGKTPLDSLILPPFELAFCLSVHKSQGSEFDEALVLLPDGSCRFGNQLLYTAITRAKKRLHIAASSDEFKKTVERMICRSLEIKEALIKSTIASS